MRHLLLGISCAAALAAPPCVPARPAPGDVVPWQAIFLDENPGNRWIWRAAQVKAESNFCRHARSYVGAVGPAQFMPGTWADAIRRGWIEPEARPDVPHDALRAQARYMEWIERFFRREFATEAGLLDASHGGYNAGPGSIKKAIWRARQLGLPGESDWLHATLPSVTKHHAKETQGYIARIRRYHGEIQVKVGGVR